MITKLKRMNDASNPSEYWSFQLNGETYYWSTGPAYMIDLVDGQWDVNGKYTSKKVGEREQRASTFLSVVRGKEPYEMETLWCLYEHLSFKGVEDVMGLVLKMLVLGEQRVDPVCYPC